jgi:FAD/FMN-containing dehydrogenase
MIATSRMAHVRVDPEARTAWIAAGTRWAQVIQETVPAGLAPLSGSSPTVGAIGYISGGGHPLMGRAHGWAADHVRRAEVVTADGQLRMASPEEDSDLFWAIRGGSGNFGVVTGLEVDLFPVDHLFAGALIFPGEISPKVLHAYREWITNLPDEMASSVAVMRLPDMPMIPEPIRGRFIVSIRICHVGGEDRGAALVEPLRAIGDRVMDTVGPMPYTQSPTIHMDPQEPLPLMFVTAALSELGERTVDALLGAVGPDADTSLLLVEVRHLGGTLARPPLLPNAVGHRDAPFNLFALSPVFPGMQDQVASDLEAVLQAATPFNTGGVLLNFLGPGDSDPSRVRRAYEPEIYARLAKVKKVFDPGNLFRLNHNIPPEGAD